MMPMELAAGLDVNALHIWPHGSHFLMALANPDGSFTGTMWVLAVVCGKIMCGASV